MLMGLGFSVKYSAPEFTKDEDELLAVGIIAHGSTDLGTVRAQFLPARMVGQIRVRLRNSCARGTENNPIKVRRGVFFEIGIPDGGGIDVFIWG